MTRKCLSLGVRCTRSRDSSTWLALWSGVRWPSNPPPPGHGSEAAGSRATPTTALQPSLPLATAVVIRPVPRPRGTTPGFRANQLGCRGTRFAVALQVRRNAAKCIDTDLLRLANACQSNRGGPAHELWTTRSLGFSSNASVQPEREERRTTRAIGVHETRRWPLCNEPGGKEGARRNAPFGEGSRPGLCQVRVPFSEFAIEIPDNSAYPLLAPACQPAKPGM